MIVTQILIVSTLRNVHRTVQRNNPLTPKSDWQLIPPGHITLESNINVTRIKNLIVQQIHLGSFRKCMVNSMENILIDVCVERVKLKYFVLFLEQPKDRS